jgi:pimeloyl-ACP methyl ester carboxylesterase
MGLSRPTVVTAGVLGMATAAGVRAAVPRGTPRIRTRGGGRAVASLQTVLIGGVDQWVLERSENADNPIVLFLHGGPGTSQLTSNRRNTRDLERFFTVVNWDQRGAGKSYHAGDPATMTIDRFVEDVRELSEHLLAKYGRERLLLVGHSWGTVIGTLAVARYPHLFSAYVGIGQIADMTREEIESWRWTLQQARHHRHRKAIAALTSMGPPPYAGDWQRSTITQRRYLGRFGGEVHGSRNGAFGPVSAGLAVSREYTLADRPNFFRGIFDSMRLLWPQLMKVNLFEQVPRLEIPVFFAEGRHDKEVPSEISAEYFEALSAPSKELFWFERSAHLPNTEERDLFNRILIDGVRPVAERFAAAHRS